MIQRIQSVYLMIAFLFSGINALLFNEELIQGEFFYILGLIISSCLFSLLAIFLFKRRTFQMKLNLLNLLLNLLIIGLLIYHLLDLSKRIYFSEESIEFIVTFILSAMVIVLLWLSNRAIKKDDRLLKSVDRIR